MEKRIALIVIAPPAGGKDRLSRGLVEHADLEFKVIGTGQLIRDRLESDPKFRAEHKAAIAAGLLLGERVMEDLIKDAVRSLRNENLILNGYPRSYTQARYLLQLLRGDYKVYTVFIDNLDEETCWKRIVRAADRGDREDDKEKSVFMDRWMGHQGGMLHVIPYLKQHTHTLSIDGTLPPEAIRDLVIRELSLVMK